VFAFHVAIPAGVSQIVIDADYLTPVDPSQGSVAMTPEMLRLYWFNAALYPAGYFVRDIQIQASIKLPDGFDYATALETESNSGGVVRFKPDSYEVLGDSPLIAGKYFPAASRGSRSISRATRPISWRSSRRC
jgi:predicted metalloprotease with PDZ domain